MQLDEFLSRRGVTLEDVANETRSRLGLMDDEVLFACGSLVEGLGNERSDVDLFLLTDRSGFTFTSLDAVLLTVGTCLIDLKVVPYARLHALIERFDAWSRRPRVPHDAIAFSQDERALLHRLHVCRPLQGLEQLELLRRRVPLHSVARLKLDLARYSANVMLVDLEGLRRDCDRHSMIFTAQELLSQGADAVLAGHGRTNPNGKWRVRQLSELPLHSEAELPGRPRQQSLRDEYVALHHAPDVDDAEAVYKHALRIAHFVRCALLFGERRILAPASDLLPAAPGDLPQSAGPALPPLGLDIAMKGDTLEIYRLPGSGEAFTLSPEATALLCLFDGVTSASAAAMAADLLVDRGQGSETIRRLRTFVANAGFAASPFIDEAAIDRLLRRDAPAGPGHG